MRGGPVALTRPCRTRSPCAPLHFSTVDVDTSTWSRFCLCISTNKSLFVEMHNVAQSGSPIVMGLAWLLSESQPPPFACVTSAALTQDDGLREWLLARDCLRWDAGDSGGCARGADDGAADDDGGEDDERGRSSGQCSGESEFGMHLIPALVDRRLAVVRQRAESRAAPRGDSGLRRGPLAGVRIERQHVYGGHMKMCPHGLQLESHSELVSARSRSGVTGGRWMYQVSVDTGGHVQVGWVTSQCHLSHVSAVGHTPLSVVFDGQRGMMWSGSEAQAVAERWVPGDMVSCCLDLDRGEARFYLNSRPLGLPLTNVRGGRGLVYYPALSMAYAQKCTLNFGGVPLTFCHTFPLPPGLDKSSQTPQVERAATNPVLMQELAPALESAPAEERRASALYLAGCLARVCKRCANPALQPEDQDVLALCDALVCRPPDLRHALHLRPALQRPAACRAGAGKREARADKGGGGGGRVWTAGMAPGAWALLAAEAIAVPLLALLDSSSASTPLRPQPTCERGRVEKGEVTVQGSHANATSPATPLGIQPCFLTREALVGMLISLCAPTANSREAPAGYDSKAAAVYGIGLLATVMDDEQARLLWPDVFQGVAERCGRSGVVGCGCDSAAPLLGLLLILLRHPASRDHCLASPARLLASCESAFTLRHLSDESLASFFEGFSIYGRAAQGCSPHLVAGLVKSKGGEEEVRSAGGEEEAKMRLSIVEEELHRQYSRVETRHAQLVLLLPDALQQSWLVSLVARNRASCASVPPPGTSDATLGSNAFFAFLSCALAKADVALRAPAANSCEEASAYEGDALSGSPVVGCGGGEVADFSGRVAALVMRHYLEDPSSDETLDLQRLGGTERHVSRRFRFRV